MPPVFSAIRLQQTAEPGEFGDVAIFVLRPGFDHPAVKSGMGTLVIVVLEELPEAFSAYKRVSFCAARACRGLYLAVLRRTLRPRNLSFAENCLHCFV